MPSNENEPEDIAPEATEAVAEQPAAPVAPAAPDYDARMAMLEQAQQNTLAMIQQGFTMLAQGQQRPEPAAPDLTDEQIEALVAEGKSGQAIRQVAAAQTARATAALKRDAIDPLGQLVQGPGMAAIAASARWQAEQSIDPSLKPYIERYRPEIDQAVGTMLPELQLRAENVAVAHGVVLAKYLPKILEEERQKVIRQLRDNPGSVPGAAVGRQARDTGPAVPTADDLFGKNSKEAQMIRKAGGEDAWIATLPASKYSSKTWPEYVAKHQAMHGQTPEGTA